MLDICYPHRDLKEKSSIKRQNYEFEILTY